MSTRCEGLTPEDTARCEECHARGFTWVIRPDGSMICSEAARFNPDDEAGGSSAVPWVIGGLGLLGLVLLLAIDGKD